MGQILITKRNGEKLNLTSKADLRGVKSAYQNVTLNSTDVLNINVISVKPIDFSIGDRIDVFGCVYTLNRMPTVSKNGSNKFDYTLEFEGVQYQLARASFELSINTTHNVLQDVQADSHIGDLKTFARVIEANMNRVMPGVWGLGVVPDTVEDKLLTFSESDNCLTVINTLCKEFDVEFWIENEGSRHIINFGEIGKKIPFTFEYGKGKGLYNLSRQNVTSSNIVTRLRAFGSSKNITTKYRSNRLCLPGKSKSESFIENEDAINKYGIWEATKYFEAIYPSRTGVVSSKIDDSILKFVDDTMFDLKEVDEEGNTKYLLNGISAKIQFNSGNLAGYDFEIKDYDHTTKTFEIKQKQDDRGDIFPSETSGAFQFNVGDKYILKDIAYPELYEIEAEGKLEEDSSKWLEQNSQPKVQYGLSVSEDLIKKITDNNPNVTIVKVGDYIPVKDTDLGIDKAVRVKAIKRNILNPFDYQITISNTADVSTVNRVISDLVEVNKVIKNNDLNNPIRTQNSWRTSREVLDMVFDPEGDYYSNKIKPESIDTIALSVGAKSMQFVLKETIFEPNYEGNKNVVNVTGGTLVHYAIEESIKDWYISDVNVTLTFDDQAYYIYAKCQKEGKAGVIVFSDKQKKVDEDATYYHFWLGVINSVNSKMNARAISLMYGFTTINGKYVTTGVIQSADGSSRFDLDNAEFNLGDSLSYVNKELKIKGAITQDSGGNEGPIVVYRGNYTDSDKYYIGNTVSFNGAVYVAKSNPPVGTSPINKEYWDIYVEKGEDGTPGKDGDSAVVFKSIYAKNGSITIAPTLDKDSSTPAGWTEEMPYADLLEYIWQTVAQFKDGEMIVKWSNPTRISGVAGGVPTGGLDYVPNKEYHGTPYRCDVVKYNSRYYIARSDIGVFKDKLPTDKNYWNDFGANFESLATEVLWANNANIGNFIFSDEVLKSQSQVNGVNKLILDGKKGAIYAQEGEFGGDVVFKGNIVNKHIPQRLSDAAPYKNGVIIKNDLRIIAESERIFLPEDDFYNGRQISIVANGFVTVISSDNSLIYDPNDFMTSPLGGADGWTGVTRASVVRSGEIAVYSRLPRGSEYAWFKTSPSLTNLTFSNRSTLYYTHRYGKFELEVEGKRIEFITIDKGNISIRHDKITVQSLEILADESSGDLDISIWNAAIGDTLFIRNHRPQKLVLRYGSNGLRTNLLEGRRQGYFVCTEVYSPTSSYWTALYSST